MALINRISRLFRADMHAVLDQLEEPDVLLRQAVREMAEEVGRESRQSKLMSEEQARLQRRIAELQEEQQQFEERYDRELDSCFAADKDDLARALIKRRLEMERHMKHMLARRSSLAEQVERHQQQLQQHQQQLSAMQQKLELLADQETGPDGVARDIADYQVRNEDVELAFLREQQKRRVP